MDTEMLLSPDSENTFSQSLDKLEQKPGNCYW